MKKVHLLATTFLLAQTCLPMMAATDLTPDQALHRLQEGNKRYLTGKSAHPRIDPDRRRVLATYGQEPVAAILGCADARVPPEIVFDQGFGDLFVVRVAGNCAGPLETASLEYAVAKLHVPLIVVLGHTQCGAVQAAIDAKPLPGANLPALMKMIEPAVQTVASVKDDHKDTFLRTIEQNVSNNESALLDKSEIIADAVKSGKVKIAGCVREIKEGMVEWLPAPAQTVSAK